MRIFISLPIISCFLLLSGTLSAAEYAVAKVKKGETIDRFLKRYHLTPHTCNIDAFCTINALKSKNKIVSGKTYKLPLMIMDYNGKTIRSSIGIEDIDIAKRVEKYNTALLHSGIRTHHYKDNKKLWYPYKEYNCSKDDEPKLEKLVAKEDNIEKIKPTTLVKAKETLTPSMTELKRKGISKITVPLMGPKYEEVNIEDFSLKGQVYYIIAGHGGPDPGAVCTDCPKQMCEDEYAYDVALRLARDLMQHGATVHMIVEDQNDGIRDEQYLDCDHDEKLLGKYDIPLNQKQRLRDRAATVNRLYKKYQKRGVKIQKSIEIHVDSRGENKRQDAFFYYNGADPESKKLAQNVQDVFEQKYAQHQKDRGYKGYVEDRNIYMVKNLLPTTLFVELANIRNTEDQKRLIINSNRQALANWLFEGLRKP
jgi:N-acetylmuramoyl-L-alanine amidase